MNAQCKHCTLQPAPAEPTPPPATPTTKRRGRTREDPSPRIAAKPPTLPVLAHPAKPWHLHPAAPLPGLRLSTRGTHQMHTPYRGEFITPRTRGTRSPAEPAHPRNPRSPTSQQIDKPTSWQAPPVTRPNAPPSLTPPVNRPPAALAYTLHPRSPYPLPLTPG